MFSNEQLGLPPDDYEYREIIKTDEHGRKVRQRIVAKTKDAFVRQARKFWGDAYDYTDSVYTDNKSPITIYCHKHDYHFTVGMAQNHILPSKGSTFKPTGCPVCMYEQQYGKQFGPEWRDYLKVSANNSRVGLIHPEPTEQKKTPEQIAAEKAEREAKQREEEAYIKKWQAKNFFEARFKERVFQMYGDQYDMTLVDYQDNDKEVTLLCPKHGFFEIKPRHLLTGITQGNGTKKPPHGCWKCCGLQDPSEKHVMTAKEFNRRVRNIYKFKNLTFPIRKKVKANSKVTATCAKHGKITHDVQWWLDGNGCEYCNGKFYPPDFERLAREAQGADYQYRDPDKVKTTADSVWVHCGNPDHQWHEMRVSLVLQGCKCRECAERHQPLEQRRENFRQRFFQKFGDNRFIVSFDEYVNNDTPISVHCIEHNYDYKTTPDNLLRKSGGCPLCTASEGEAVIKGWLDNHGIPHEWHAKIPNEDPTLPLQYVEPDFWLAHLNLYIEYHGAQHYEDIDYFYKGKRIRNFAVQQHRDRYLREYCHRHGHNLLEIPYWDFKQLTEILSDVLLKGKTDYSTYYVNRRD